MSQTPNPIPQRTFDRMSQGLKALQPVIRSAVDRDINEADTVTIVMDVLTNILGYDKYSEVTKEYAIRGTYVDLAIKINDKLHIMIEVKSAAINLKDNHMKQAIDYAANKGCDYVILTNGQIWQVYHVHFEKPIDHDLVFELDILTLNSRKADSIYRLFMLSREAAGKDLLKKHHAQQTAVNRYAIAAIIQSEAVVDLIRRELRRLVQDVRIESADIEERLREEVLKRETIEGEHAAEARKMLEKASKAKLRNVVAKPAMLMDGAEVPPPNPVDHASETA